MAVALRKLQAGVHPNLLINHLIYYVVTKGDEKMSLADRCRDVAEYYEAMKTARPY